MSRALCDHPTFETAIAVNRITAREGGPVLRFNADLQIRCAQCGVRFRWLGLEGGHHPTEPRVSLDAFELRAPLEPDAHLTSLMADCFPFPAGGRDG